MGNVAANVDIARSFEHYRALMDNPEARSLSMEFEGLDFDEFSGALADSRTATLELAGKPDILIPLGIPIEYLPWYNRPYFDQSMQMDGALYYYNNQPLLLDSQPGDYVDVLARIIDEVHQTGGLLVTDHAHHDKPVVDRDITYVAASRDLKVKDVLDGADPPAQHYMYARQLLRRDRTGPRHTELDLYSEYLAAKERGAWDSEKAELLTEITGPEATQIWRYYHQAFAKHNTVDPILASFTEDQFMALLASPEFYKFVYQERGEVANVLLIADIRRCPWMNQAYFAHQFPTAYRSGNIYYSPGVVSDPDSNTPSKSLLTMGLLIKTFCQAEVEPVITFVCDEVSNTQVPRLTEHSVNRTGILMTDISYPDALHIIRGFRFK